MMSSQKSENLFCIIEPKAAFAAMLICFET